MKEITRLIHAFGYSLEGLRFACRQPAFRTELAAALVMLPLGLWLAAGGTERALLMGSVFLVLIVELLNSAVESAIDRISTEIHPLSKCAKDLGSAAVLVSLINTGCIWLAIIGPKL